MEAVPIPISTTLEANTVEVGRRLTRLDWHVRTAVVCASSDHARGATKVLQELDVLAVAMNPDGGGGRFRRSIRSMLTDWDGWMATEYFGESWQELHIDREARAISSDDDLVDELLWLAPEFGERIESDFDRSFDAVRLKHILSLGRTLEEGCLPTRGWRRGLLERTQNGRPRFAPWNAGVDVNIPDEGWVEEIRLLWQIAEVRGWPPEPPVEAFTDSDAAARYVSEVAAAARKSLGVSFFVATPLQMAIWIALAGKALTKKSLAKKVCGGDSRRLYRRGGLSELTKRKWVVNTPTIGFFRPDFPPPELVIERYAPN